MDINKKQKRNKSTAISQVIDLKQTNIKAIKDEIAIIDKEIIELMSGLFEAKKVQIKSALNTNNNFLFKLQRKFISSAATQSAYWHENNLKNLYQKRKFLQINLEKITGTYWKNKIKRIFFITILIFIIALVISLILMGILLTAYLLPLLLFGGFVYILIQNKVIRRRR